MHVSPELQWPWVTLTSAPSGLERDKFDNKTVSFEEHIKFEHNMWNYLYFIVLVRVKNKTDYTGPESYVAQMIKVCPAGGGGRRTPAESWQEKGSWSQLPAHLWVGSGVLKEPM